MKRFISLIIALAMVFTLTSQAFAQDSLTADAIRFGQDGKLKIMHVTDTHLDFDNVDASVWAIGVACDREQPDVVVITGDNVTNKDDANETKALIDKLMGVFEEREIPVAGTFGNHDSECGAMSREELMAYYNTFSCSVSVDDGDALPGCGTYNVPVLASDSDEVKFNIWVFDSGDYDDEGHYACVTSEQVEWYKAKSDELTAANGGEKVYSVAFQHIIVDEIYDALEKADGEELFSFEHMYNDGEYYRFDPDNKNYGTLNETPCSGYNNFGQFDAMVDKGDVLAIFTGHDHTNAFGVEHMGIDIMNSLSTRYNSDAYSAQYGYRIIEVDENDTSVYTSRSVHWYDMFSAGDVINCIAEGDSVGVKTSGNIVFLGFWQKLADVVYRTFAAIVTGRTITYAD